MRVVIMGAGRTGSLLAQMLEQADHQVTIIDWNPAAFSRLTEDFSGKTVLGNAVDQDVLRTAGIETADVFVAATSGDNRNVMASQVAMEVFKVPKVVSRVKDPIRAQIYQALGIQVDCRTSQGVKIVQDLL